MILFTFNSSEGAKKNVSVLQTLACSSYFQMKNSSDGHGVLVIAATNRPTALDSAILRPGRLDSLIYVRPPDERERREILGLVSVRGRMSRDVDLNYLAAQTALYSGADLTHLYREVCLVCSLQFATEVKVATLDTCFFFF